MEDVEPFVVKALQAFKSKEKTELSFKKGQTITVEKRNVETDTYFGFYSKHEGWFPNYYVVAVEGTPELRKSKAKAAPKKEAPPKKDPKKEVKESNGGPKKEKKSEVKEAKKKALNDKKEAKEQKKEAKKKEKADGRNTKRRGTKAANGDAQGPAAATHKPEEGIPPIIEDTIAYLEREDRLKLEGLFRVSGSTNDVKTIQASFLKGKRVDLEKISDPHTVAGVLKIFLREAKDPLLTFELYDCWVTAIATPGSVADKAKAVRQVVDLLPVTNRLILNRLMGLLNKVSKHSKVNLMTVNNIAIVFAPTLLRPPGDQLDIALQDSSYANHLVKFMIEEYDAVFLFNPSQNKEAATPTTDEELQKRMRRGSLALARGSIIGGQNTFQRANKTEDESPSEISVDYQDATDATEATETDESESDKVSGAEEEEPVEETGTTIKPLTMQQMMDMILDGQVNEVDTYLATLPPDQTAKTKKELLERIDAMMQSEEFKE